MSNFETYLQDWCNTIAENEALTAEDISELEDHLQADFLRLKETGLCDQDAFWLAAKRLGETDTICSEFRKVNGTSLWTRRVQWMIIGYLAVSLLNVSINMISKLAATIAALFASGWISFIVYGAAQIALLFGMVYIVYNLLFGTESFLNVLANGFHFVKLKPKGLLLIAFSGMILLSVGSKFFMSVVRSHMLDPYQYGSYAYGETILNIVFSILVPALLISLIFKSQRNPRKLQSVE
jgi:hypothetical protein